MIGLNEVKCLIGNVVFALEQFVVILQLLLYNNYNDMLRVGSLPTNNN